MHKSQYRASKIRQSNLHRNIGSDMHILRPAAAPTRYLFEHYFVSDYRASLRLRNGIPPDYLIPFLFPISPGTKFRIVVSLSNGRRVSISRAKSAKWISIRPSTKSIPLAAPIPFFPRRLFPSFLPRSVAFNEIEPARIARRRDKIRLKIVSRRAAELELSLPEAVWNRYNPVENASVIFWSL